MNTKIQYKIRFIYGTILWQRLSLRETHNARIESASIRLVFFKTEYLFDHVKFELYILSYFIRGLLFSLKHHTKCVLPIMILLV